MFKKNLMKSNLLLINPRINESSQNRRINAMINVTFPTSLGILASYVMPSVVDSVKIVDEQIHPIDDNGLGSFIGELKSPKVIGMSVLTINCGRAYELAKKIKMIDAGAVVVLGGIHPTVAPEEALSKEGVDIVVRGEGEETFRELLLSIRQLKDYRKIDGISYRNNGKIVHNLGRLPISDLDSIPPFPYHLFEEDFGKYPNVSGVFTSRGCPYNCSFCSSRSISGK